MVDLHTHILPGIDDGARNADVSVNMLRLQRDQGVDTVVLTPHFYRHREEPEEFLRRRRRSWDRLQRALDALAEEERSSMPGLMLGCEVAWVPNLGETDCLPELCIQGTKNMLLELPFSPWSSQLCSQIYDLMGRTGITPILVHLERYIRNQPPEMVEEVLSMGLPVQLSADMLLRFASRGKSLKALKSWAHILASDCHDPDRRQPCMGRAMEVVEKKLGRAAADAIDLNARQLLRGINP